MKLTRGTLHLDVWLNVMPGEVVALLGPNGAGKTTILRCLAGLLPLDRGSIELRGHVVDDPAASVFIPSEHRSCGVVFQQYLLFPHMSVLENVAFGLRAHGVDKASAHQLARRWLAKVGSEGQERSRPHELSGGQAQRVALARALAPQPKLLLLDEPLAALDARTKIGVRRELQRHLAEFAGCAVLVTHDPVDAYTLADRVVIVENGHVVQDGSFVEIAAHPRSAYVAELVGVNLVTGVMMGGGVFAVDGGATLVVTEADVDGPAIAVIRPQAVSLHVIRPEGSPRNTWPASVIDVDHRADVVRVRLEGPVPLTAEITAAAADALRIKVGLEVWAAVKATEIAVTLN
ncbi:MAG TPA: ABC transporter ATP-binding protein [Ilumatobacteraceae bacterium]|jgi:molybdate transport system ATP-binding protein